MQITTFNPMILSSKADEIIKLFEDLGFVYHQVEDGNNVEIVCSALEAAKRVDGPVFIHAVTTKGKGFAPAEQNPGEFHGVSAFDIENVPDPDAAPKDSYSTIFGKNLSEKANKNDKLCAITAAMKYGTGLQFFYRDHKSRFFDVGMAEEHAVTFAAALAKADLQPVVCLYSTFMQRAMDQYIHDVMLMKLNVMFGIDRAGLVPGDGETHQGIHDIGIFANYTDTPVVCPSNYNELVWWQNYLIDNVNGPKVIRYSRGGQDDNTKDYQCTGNLFDVITSGQATDNLIVCYGRHFTQCLEAQNKLKEQGIQADILKINMVNPVPDGAVEIAQGFGLSENLIGLTIVACGTGLPELVTSVVAARKNEVEMALGNVIGSNIFNILLVLGVAATISPIAFIMENVIDIILLTLMSVLVWIFGWSGNKVERKEGLVMLGIYAAYLVYICIR